MNVQRPELAYVTAEELVAYLRTDREGTVVLDVRDSDFNDLGHIAGCLNLSAWLLLSGGGTLDHFIQTHLRRSRTRRVVVHCFLSMQRGPSVAHRLVERLQQLEDPLLLSPDDVYILKRGFRAFYSAFKSEKDLVVVC